jgi:hypothetical protein
MKGRKSIMGQSHLEVLTGDLRGENIIMPVNTDKVVLGRGQDALFSIIDPKVSRTHALLRFAEGQWYIQDQGSPNGTFVNGELTIAKAIHDNDIITVGDTTMRFRIQSPVSNQNRIGIFDEQLIHTDPPPESFVKKAWLVFALYYFGLFIGGFILNLIYLSKALKISKETGKAPAGKNFLIVLLVVHSIGLIILVTLCVVFWIPIRDSLILNWDWLMGIINTGIIK